MQILLEQLFVHVERMETDDDDNDDDDDHECLYGPSGRFLLLQVALNPALAMHLYRNSRECSQHARDNFQPSQGFVKLFDTALRVAETDEGPNRLL